jgi:hypothetical protein
MSYDDLSSLHTFGFRGEAISSLCALADFHIVTAQGSKSSRFARGTCFSWAVTMWKSANAQSEDIASPRATTSFLPHCAQADSPSILALKHYTSKLSSYDDLSSDDNLEV